MARKGTISIAFRIEDGKDGLKMLTADAKALRKVFEENARAANAMSDKVLSSAAAVTTLSATQNALSQLSSVLRDTAGDSLNFSSAMRAANTMASKDSEGFSRLTDEVSELAKTLPVARDELAKGLYQVISNGVPEDNWISFLNASARSSVGGIADLGQVVGVTSTIIKNYGLEWSAAADIQDKIQLTAKNGVTSFEQLAQALPRVTGNAATLGVTVDELCGVFSTLTGVSGNTAEVSTQLAAIFTSLVKPSSEASKMAQEMGIQFDAASIKAAGGLQNFLTSLDQSVKSYALASGVLEEEVYGRLFGSAEALRALTPLQGELAAKFADNVDKMVNSAGTMDAAFADMSSTEEAHAQMLRNNSTLLSDLCARVVESYGPLINLSTNALMTATSVMMLGKSIKSLTVVQALFGKTSRLAGIGIAALVGPIRTLSAEYSAATTSAARAAVATRGFAFAVKGLLITTGVGVAIWALAEVIGYFVRKSDEAKAATEGLTEAESKAAREAEYLDQVRQQEERTLTNVRAQLEQNISRLKAFKGTKQQEISLVRQMNSAYGETMGYFSSVSDWYKALVSNSKAYCRQMVAEARARLLADRIAKIDQERYDLMYDENGNKRKYRAGGNWKVFDVPEWATDKDRERWRLQGYTIKDGAVWTSSEKDIKQHNYDDLTRTRNVLQGLLDGTYSDLGDITLSVTGSPNRPDMGDGKDMTPGKGTTTVRELTEIDRLNDEIRKKQEECLTASDEELETLREQTLELVRRRDALKARQDRLVTEDYTPPAIGDIKTYSELDKALTYYRKKLADADEEDRKVINAIIKSLEELRDAWDAALNPTAPDRTDLDQYIEQITEASRAPFPFMKSPLDGLGLQELTDRYRQIQAILSDMDADITDRQRESLRLAAEEYKKYIDKARTSFDTYREAWGTVSGITSGIQSMTDALRGNGSAWQKVSAVINAFLQIYDGLKALIDLINQISGTTIVNTSTTTVPIPDPSGATPMASGGIVSGPTLCLTGEYPGAATNPEVIAPLDKLRSLITPAGGPVEVTGTLRASGRELVCVMANETRISGKSGRRTDIKL